MQADRRVGTKLLSLVKATLKDPFDGVGKPERLRQFAGDVWSRRITQEHRLVYQVQGNRIQFLQGRYHY
ncbi:MAG: Txe/YoeB family addiction module toxin [Aquiluna sp.]|nr:Txe/YoeB family addiction module toxin [Aquiluna sp.]MCF8545848.1 Txe/YoeB family addiction module toxin [Aquiluna sp.]